MRAKYAFMGAAAEFTRTVPLAENEEVLLHGVMRLRRIGRLPRPVVLRLTAQRLSVLFHYAFQPDRIWDVPRASIQDVRFQNGALQMAWASDERGGAIVLRLTGWTGRPAMESPLYDAGAVAELLTSWLDSPDGRLREGPPHSHRAH